MTAIPAPRVVCIGEPLVALIAREPGPLWSANEFTAHVTGAELNVAVGLARQGVATAFVGRRGADPHGERVARTLRAEGVDARGLRVDDEAGTAMLVRSLRPVGVAELQYARRGCAGSRLDAGDIAAAADAIAGADWLHVTGVTPALSPSAGEAVRAAIEIAREAGTAVSFDVNLRTLLGPVARQRDVLLALARDASLVFCGEDEGRLLTGGDGPEAIAAALRGRATTDLVVKLGARGAVHFGDGGASVSAGALEVVALDLVGAGDAFAAGYLAAVLRGAPPADALRAAAGTAACAITTRGDIEGLPGAWELEATIDGDGLEIVR